jgi:uncharacterized protein involved in response to NO
MENTKRPRYSGPALFSYGFRPFFLLAGLFALLVVPLWMAVWSGFVALSGPFSPVDWHIHEMLFGYTSAVIAGFLFTAIPNWTGRLPTRGWPLMVLAALWALGRIAVAGGLGLSPVQVMILDCAFMALIGAMVVVEIVAGRNWSNLKVVAPVLFYLAANVTFHWEVMAQGQAAFGRRLGFAMVVLLILLIGGRIIPSFTRNWLVKRGPGPLPAPFGRFDAASLAATLMALLLWVALPHAAVSAIGLMLAALVQAVRLSRWLGWRTVASPLLVMLHLAFAFLPCGLFALGLAGLDVVPSAIGLHLLGIGGIGGMTLAVMMRASLGHTGRVPEVGPMLATAFACVALSALVRVIATDATGLWLAAALWVAGFAGFLVRYSPILASANAGLKKPNLKEQ